MPPIQPAIDLHCHIFPPIYLQLARTDGERIGAQIYRRPDGREFIRAPGDFDYPLTDDLWSVPALVNALEGRNLTMAALSVAPPTLSYWAEPGLGAEISAAMNDSLGEIAQDRPDRFVALATVPLQDIPRAVAELERVMKRPGFRGLMIASHLGEHNLDDDYFIPLWEAAEALGACVFIHPYQVLGTERLQNYYLWNLIGMVTETCVAIESLIFGGIYERFPRLKTYFAHAGGSFPWLRGRAEHGFQVLKNTRFNIDRLPSTYLNRIYVDNMIYIPSALTWLTEQIGSNHIVVGSDYPFDIGPADPTRIVREAPGLSEPDRANILWNSAADLLGLGPG